MTPLNVLRVRKRRHRWNTEPHLSAQGLLLILGGLSLLLLVWIFLGLGPATLVATLAAAAAAVVPWVRGSMYRTYQVRHHSPVPDDKPLRGFDTAHLTWRPHEVPDPERRFKRFGLLTLVLAPLFLVLVFSTPRETYQRLVVRANTPEPRDCDWISSPIGDKHCHYESSFTHVHDEQGEHIIAIWHRVGD
jgi:hypothetical protein